MWPSSGFTVGSVIKTHANGHKSKRRLKGLLPLGPGRYKTIILANIGKVPDNLAARISVFTVLGMLTKIIEAGRVSSPD